MFGKRENKRNLKQNVHANSLLKKSKKKSNTLP